MAPYFLFHGLDILIYFGRFLYIFLHFNSIHVQFLQVLQGHFCMGYTLCPA